MGRCVLLIVLRSFANRDILIVACYIFFCDIYILRVQSYIWNFGIFYHNICCCVLYVGFLGDSAGRHRIESNLIAST